MFDTVKVRVNLTESQHGKLLAYCNRSSTPEWVRYIPESHDILFVNRKSIVKTDSESFHRELRYHIDPRWSENAVLTIELSLPKLWYGENIHLLYDAMKPLSLFKGWIEEQCGLAGEPLPAIADWHLSRVDICYAWNFQNNQALAQRFLDQLKLIKFPWKQRRIIHETSVFYPGSTYSVKFYLKLPEFTQHDRKALIGQNEPLEWIEWLESEARGLLRFEVTLKRQWLRVNDVGTIGKLLEPVTVAYFSCGEPRDEEEHAAWLNIVAHHELATYGFTHLSFEVDATGVINPPERLQHPIKIGEPLQIPRSTLNFNGKDYEFPGGTVEIQVVNRAKLIAQMMIARFTGGVEKMSDSRKVIEILQDNLKPRNAADLAAFWTFVQTYGSNRAKELYGKDKFYRMRKQLLDHDISLIEPPPADVIKLSDFRFRVPSDLAINKVDLPRGKKAKSNVLPKAK